jgi:hypothetical protein
MMNSGVMAQPRPVGRPPVGQAIPQIQQQAVMPQQPPASAMMPRASANTPVSWTNAPQPVQPNPGLYGRLNDDVARAPAPVVNAPALQAPVVPVQPVQQMPLAGAVPR